MNSVWAREYWDYWYSVWVKVNTVHGFPPSLFELRRDMTSRHAGFGVQKLQVRSFPPIGIVNNNKGFM